MFHRASRKGPNVYTVLVALLAALTASGAVVGTVFLTRAPGATLGPKSVIVRALSLDFIGSFDGEEGLDNGPLTADPIGPNSAHSLTPGLADAVGRFWADAGGFNKTLTMATANGIQTGTRTNALSGANTRSDGTTSSDGTLLFASGNTTRSGASATTQTINLLTANDIEWTGATNTTWSTGTNWSGGSKPSSTQNAVFDLLFSNQPNLTSNQTVGGLWMTTGVGQNVTISASSGTLTLDGNTINSIANLGILVDNSSAFTLTVTASLKLGNDQTWTNNSGNLLTVSGTVNLNHNTLTVDGTGNTSIGGAISNSGSTAVGLIKNGSGTLTLTGANAYGGATQVNAGTLLINGNQSGAT